MVQRLSRMELHILIGNIWFLTSYTSFMYPTYCWTVLPPGCLFLSSHVESWGMSLFICVLIRSSHEVILLSTSQGSLQPGSPQSAWEATNCIPSASLVPWWGGKSATLQLWFCVLLVLPYSKVSSWQGSYSITISLYNEQDMLDQSSLSSPSSGVASVSSSLRKGWQYLLARCSSTSHL